MKYAILFSKDKPLAIIGYEANYIQLFHEFDGKVVATGFESLEEAKKFVTEFIPKQKI